MKICSILIALAITLSSNAAATAEDAYTVGDIRLGMPLNEFRQLNYPDPHKLGFPPMTVCSNDSISSIVSGMERPTQIMARAGVLICTYAQMRSTSSANTRGIELGEFREIPINFTFISQKSDAPSQSRAPMPRLVSIELKLGTIPFDAAVSYVTKIYGTPAAEPATEGKSKRLGAPAESRKWENKESTISLTKSPIRGDVRLMFEHKALAAVQLNAYTRVFVYERP
jgi:hypothetical protein